MKKSILIATALLGLPVALQAQHPQPRAGADPFVPAYAPAEVAGADGDDTLEDAPPEYLLRYETFSLPLADAAALQRKNPADCRLLQGLSRHGGAQASGAGGFTMVRARSGRRRWQKSISETIYPPAWSRRSFRTAFPFRLGRACEDERRAARPLRRPPPARRPSGRRPRRRTLRPATRASPSRSSRPCPRTVPRWICAARRITSRGPGSPHGGRVCRGSSTSSNPSG